MRRSYVPDSDDELETSAPPPRRQGQTAHLEAESDFEGEEAQEEGSQEEDFTEDEIAQSEESEEELDSEDGYESGMDKRNKTSPGHCLSDQLTVSPTLRYTFLFGQWQQA